MICICSKNFLLKTQTPWHVLDPTWWQWVQLETLLETSGHRSWSPTGAVHLDTPDVCHPTRVFSCQTTWQQTPGWVLAQWQTAHSSEMENVNSVKHQGRFPEAGDDTRTEANWFCDCSHNNVLGLGQKNNCCVNGMLNELKQPSSDCSCWTSAEPFTKPTELCQPKPLCDSTNCTPCSQNV